MPRAPIARAPVIETGRLRLRAHTPADLDARTAMLRDPDVYRFLGGAPQSRQESWERIQRYAGHWALLGWGLFAVEERASGGLLGEVGLARFERGFGPDFDLAPEAAWIIAASAAGRGYATEAMATALAWYHEHLGVQRLVCVIASANQRSRRLAERLGFRPFREVRYRDQPAILHERLPTSTKVR